MSVRVRVRVRSSACSNALFPAPTTRTLCPAYSAPVRYALKKKKKKRKKEKKKKRKKKKEREREAASVVRANAATIARIVYKSIDEKKEQKKRPPSVASSH